MPRLRLRHALLSAALAFPLFAASEAHAGIEACGDIYVEAEAMCEVLVDEACVAKCEPVSFNAACAAELEVSCAGMCNAQAMASCTGGCQTNCLDICDVEPGSFECQGECNASCTASCDADCSASSNQAECRASCEATCDAHCEGSCEGTPPSATCDAKGVARITTLPPGEHRLLVGASGAATAEGTVVSPGGELDLFLPQPGLVRLSAPTVAARDALLAVSAVDAAGTPYRILGPIGSRG